MLKSIQNSSQEVSYYVRRQAGTGTGYLIPRKMVTRAMGQYRWSKTAKSNAVVFNNLKAARRSVTRYGGNVVRCVRTVVRTKRATRVLDIAEKKI